MDSLAPFQIGRLPKIIFGAGSAAEIPAASRRLARRALLVTGARSFLSGPAWPRLRDGLGAAGVAFETVIVTGEPSPELVDGAVARFRDHDIGVVIGIGGGSALDAAKAIAGLLRVGRPVTEYLEGVGPERAYEGPAVPMIAVPTTAGTGSEATKNAVLSRPRPHAFKKSFRHEDLVPRLAVVDPDLLATCPPAVIAANGMDAFTQLLESFTSTRANAFTDALAWSGLEAFRDGFFAAYEGGETPAARAGRSRMAYAALVSGVCLAQTGLGAVHGLASPLGAHFPVPHGVCCGTLVAVATAANIGALTDRMPQADALARYAQVGRLLSGQKEADDIAAREILTGLLHEWTDRLALPRLGAYGMAAGDVDGIIAESRGSSMKTNPIVLTDAEIGAIVSARL